MKIFSFNVNGLRARLHQMSALIDKHSPDIICLQETKVDNENYPMESINELGYKAIINGQKGHYGVSTLYKSEPLDFQLGFPTDEEDAQCRLISSRHKFSSQEVTIINGYFPQGESRDHPKKFPYKEKFFKDLMIYLNENFSPDDNIIILGDLNISPEDIDIYKKISEWPKCIEISSKKLEPHRVPTYLYELSSLFHSYWNMGKDDKSKRFISEDKKISDEKLVLLKSVSNVIKCGMNLVGASTPEKM